MISLRKLSKIILNIQTKSKPVGILLQNKYLFSTKNNTFKDTKFNNNNNKLDLKPNQKQDQQQKQFKKLEKPYPKLKLNVNQNQQEKSDDDFFSVLDQNEISKNFRIQNDFNEENKIKNTTKNASGELTYLSNFNENFFNSEEDLKCVLTEKAFEIKLENIDKEEFKEFCCKFPMFSLIILGNNFTNMKQEGSFFTNENTESLKDYLAYIRKIFIKSKYLKNKDFYAKQSFKVIDNFINVIKFDTDSQTSFKNSNNKDFNNLNKNKNSKNENKTKINQTNESTESIMLEFIKDFSALEEMETMSSFYFYYALLANFSKLKPILISDDKLDFSYDLSNIDFTLEEPNFKLMIDLLGRGNQKNSFNKFSPVSSKENTQVQKIEKKITLKSFLISNFPNIFMKLYKKEYLTNNLLLTKHLFNLIILYEMEFIEDKKHMDINLSLFLNVLDEILENHIFIGKNDILIMNLMNIISCYRIIAKDDMRGFQNIYSVMAKRFMKIEDLFAEEKANFIFVYFLFLKFVHKSVHGLKDVVYLLNANFFYLDFKINTQPERLRQSSTWLLCHLLMVCGYCNFNVHENLFLEIKNRIPKIIEEFNLNLITYLVTGVVLNHKKDDTLFYEILTKLKYDLRSKKNFLNIGFYISLTQYDNAEAWKIYLGKLESFLKILNEFDRRQVLEMTMNLLITKGIKSNKQVYEYVDTLIKLVSKETKFEEAQHKSKWFFKVYTSHGLLENTFRNFLEKKKIKFEYQKNLFKIFDVDFLIGDKIVIYLNGPIHYSINGQQEMNLKSHSKTRILEDKGYYVINVPLEDCTLVNHRSDTELIILDYIKGKLPPEVYDEYFNGSNSKRDKASVKV